MGATDDYGTDVALFNRGLSPQWPLVSGDRTLGYNFFRRLTTRPSMPAYKGNSLDLADYLQKPLKAGQLGAIEREIIRVATFEPRISTVRPKVTLDADQTMRVSVKIQPVLGEAFVLVMDVSSVSSAVVSIGVV